MRPPRSDATPAVRPEAAAADRADLDFERRWSGSATAKARAVRASFGVSLTRYHQALDRALELPEALEHDPMMVRRLRRLRAERRARRTVAALGERSQDRDRT